MMQTLKPSPVLGAAKTLLHHQQHHNNHTAHHQQQHPSQIQNNTLASTLLSNNMANMELHQHQQHLHHNHHNNQHQHHHHHHHHHHHQQVQTLLNHQQISEQQQQRQQVIHHHNQHPSLLLPTTNNHNPQIIIGNETQQHCSIIEAPADITAALAVSATTPTMSVVTSPTPCSLAVTTSSPTFLPLATPLSLLAGVGPSSNNRLQSHHLSEISCNSNTNNNNNNSNNNNNNNEQDDPNPEMVLALISRNRELEATIPKCGGCHELILDRFILKVLERTWHAKCLQCSECRAQLNDKCFARNGQLFCKEDFFKSSNRRYGTKCSACDMGIPPTQVVRRAQDNVYHLQCFLCAICSRTLNTGDEFYLMEDRKLVCKRDYDEAKAKGLYLDGSLDGDQPNKRPRTTITAKQLETLKTAYNNSPKPARHVREQLSQDTGLDMRVVQVWFQNRRAKEKRLKKDAGRTRWSQYFRSMKGSCSPRTEKFLDKDDLKVDYDSFSHHDLSNDSYSTVNLGLDEVASPHSLRGSYLHGSSSPSHYPSSRSPPVGQNHSFGSYPDNVVYTNIDHNSTSNMHGSKSHHLHAGSAVSDLSNDSSPEQGFPDFPPSPDSWLGDSGNTSNPNSSTPATHY